MSPTNQLKSLEDGMVVSCQAQEDNPLHGPFFMAAMAEAAVQGGAAGIRAEGVDDISAIRQRVGQDVPIMGILKTKMPDASLFITATAGDARRVIDAGAELVALDGTRRPRPGGDSLEHVISVIHAAGGMAMADIDTLESAMYAIESGADAVGTTMAGFTLESAKFEGPDFTLLETLVKQVRVPVFAEGRIWTREEAVLAFNLGASFVVVGTAITNPLAITERFVDAIRRR